MVLRFSIVIGDDTLNASLQTDTQAATLLEQLLRIARVSALEEMASGMAHELNQPLGAIATFAQAGRRMLAKPEPMLPEAKEVMERIAAEALHAGAGVHRIRNLFDSRNVTRTTCDYGKLIREMMPVLNLLVERRGVTLQLSVAKDLPLVSADSLRIQHVLFTLIQNAIEASNNASSAQIRIDVTGDRFGVKTVIDDRGAGVSAENRENIFRPFFTTKAHGTGLGLASSRAIIERHDGKIGFENLPAGGARFWFQLPAAAPESTSR